MLTTGKIGLAALAMLAVTGCSSVTPSSETPAQKFASANFDLSKCEVLEPSLYRCPGVDRPLCDPDFQRDEVECLKITKHGVLLQAFPENNL
ncbi:MAG TPA: hypothetical protein VMV13_02090 [Candidatus Binataceae bacterium]|nr:hypothetical protein [Candidatus Binataceae bacterium]